MSKRKEWLRETRVEPEDCDYWDKTREVMGDVVFDKEIPDEALMQLYFDESVEDFKSLVSIYHTVPRGITSPSGVVYQSAIDDMMAQRVELTNAEYSALFTDQASYFFYLPENRHAIVEIDVKKFFNTHISTDVFPDYLDKLDVQALCESLDLVTIIGLTIGVDSNNSTSGWFYYTDEQEAFQREGLVGIAFADEMASGDIYHRRNYNIDKDGKLIIIVGAANRLKARVFKSDALRSVFKYKTSMKYIWAKKVDSITPQALNNKLVDFVLGNPLTNLLQETISNNYIKSKRMSFNSTDSLTTWDSYARWDEQLSQDGRVLTLNQSNSTSMTATRSILSKLDCSWRIDQEMLGISMVFFLDVVAMYKSLYPNLFPSENTIEQNIDIIKSMKVNIDFKSPSYDIAHRCNITADLDTRVGTSKLTQYLLNFKTNTHEKVREVTYVSGATSDIGAIGKFNLSFKININDYISPNGRIYMYVEPKNISMVGIQPPLEWTQANGAISFLKTDMGTLTKPYLTATHTMTIHLQDFYVPVVKNLTEYVDVSMNDLETKAKNIIK